MKSRVSFEQLNVGKELSSVSGKSQNLRHTSTTSRSPGISQTSSNAQKNV